MYYKILINQKWVPKGFVGVTIYPFIIFKKRDSLADEILIAHEKIHIKQQLELLVVFFYIWYILEFLIKVVQLRDKKKAYKAISFEREAYLHETELNYLQTRKFAAFLKYI
ncbi:hypothetical protein [Flavobacterium sp. NKUCC04_CG]|uniref:hypothetical protein n=1 Tax=Flavobacterium sp. NKUCC04_CG TaxID=2842121 RepID=UPI001C5B3CB4|nr:hypothetical protein [Flavobacterium sp. NKUCC04_CG]MBW3517741.1 hypothetical protein [Flavobacterium sp. NKUCC04_CG]